MTARVEPPAEHRALRWHWLADVDGDVWPARWSDPTGGWALPGRDWQTDDDMALLGWRYFAPALPPGPCDG